MPHKVLPKLPLQTSFEVRPWASHALKTRGTNVALPAMAAVAIDGSSQPAWVGTAMRDICGVGA